jgi:outer membrane lipoprotein-sorting protein
MRRQCWSLNALAVLLLAPGLAWGQPPDANELLKKMDDVTSGYADQEMDVDLVIGDVDGSKKIYGMTVWQQGEKRLVRFTSGETKGMATLIDGDRVYVFMPGFKKIRRIASHNMKQSFAGSDFSNTDMSTISWAADYDVVFEKETDTQYVLRGKPKAGKNIEYASVLLYLAKDGYYQDAVDYFNEKGEKVKEFLGKDKQSWPGNVQRFKLLIMRDPRTGHTTEMHVKTFKVNQGLTEDNFTKRQLQWGGK